MITHGTRPAKHIYKEKQFHHKYGSISGTQIPDFNLDADIYNPNQEFDNAPTECVGYTVADILTDIFKMRFDPDFSYAAGRYIAGDGPGIDGTSFHAGIQGAIGVGALPLASIPQGFDAKGKGELFVSDFNNWEPYLKTIALKYVQNGLLNVLGNGLPYDSILSALWKGKIAISLASPWFAEWQGLPGESILPMPANPSQQASDPSTPWHNYAAKGQKTVTPAGTPIGTIPIKSWQGNWLYMTPQVANVVFQMPGTGALTFDPAAIRWIQIVAILMQRFPYIPASDIQKLLLLKPV